MGRLLAIVLACWSIVAAAGEPGADWPQFLGPSRDAIYRGKDLAAQWPGGAPKILWEKKLGYGWSSPAVCDGRLYIFHRVDDKETVECLEAASGKAVWSASYPTTYQDDFGFDNGPRSTPTIDEGRVFTFGADGKLTAWEAGTGKAAWSFDTRAELNSDKGYFGMVCSPLVEGNLVILNIGGKDNAGIVAFDKHSGKVAWKATKDEAGYSSPVAATVEGARYVFSLTRAGLVALEPESGKVDWQFPFRSRSAASVNAATPLVIDDSIFLTASYGTGAALLKFNPNKPEKVWANEESFSAHYATPVYHDGYIYGYDGRQEQGCNLRCIELKTGTVKWSEDGFGAGTVILAGDDLLLLTEKGELVRAAASPDGFKVKSKAAILGSEVRSNGAIAGGLYFARDKSKLVCVDLRK